MKKQIRVGCSPLTGTIFAGTLLKDGRTWASGKHDVTLDALVAVAQHIKNFGKDVQITDAAGNVEFVLSLKENGR
jgi:hypothetical protein